MYLAQAYYVRRETKETTLVVERSEKTTTTSSVTEDFGLWLTTTTSGPPFVEEVSGGTAVSKEGFRIDMLCFVCRRMKGRLLCYSDDREQCVEVFMLLRPDFVYAEPVNVVLMDECIGFANFRQVVRN